MPKVKRTNIPNVISGGIATPLGNNMYLMIGRTHEQGGIDIGNTKNGLEVENGEVLKASRDNVRVYSAKPILNGTSPAELVLDGKNPNKVFTAQEEFKKENNLNDDGTKKSKSKIRRVSESFIDRAKTNFSIVSNVADALIRNPIQSVFGKTQTNNSVGKTYNATDARLARIQANIDKRKLPTKVGDIKPFGIKAAAIKKFNSDDGKYATFDKSKLIDALQGGVSAFEYNNGQTSGYIQIDPEDNNYYIAKLTDAYTFDDSNQNDKDAANRSTIRGILGKRGRKDGDEKATKQIFYYKVPVQGNDTVKTRAVFPEDYENGNPNKEELKRYINLFEQKAMGGLSRKQDYGSKKKPYPTVNSFDFAGGNRSYPIPTKADAIDALRLAGLHGRSDVKSKIYAKYPSLKKAELGTNIENMQLENLNLRPAIVTALSPNTLATMNYTANLMKDIKEERRNNTKKKETKEQIVKLDTSVPKLTNFKRKAPFGTKYPYGKDMLISVNRSDLNPENPNYNKYTIDDKGNRKVYPNQVDIKPIQVINGQLVPTDRSLPNLQKLPTDILTTQSSIVGGNILKPTLPTGSLVENYKPVDNGLIPKLKHLENPDTYSDTGLIRRNLNIENIPKLDSLPSGNLVMPKSQDKIVGFNGYTVGDAAQDAVNLSKVKATNPSTGSQPKAASGSGWSIGSDLIRGAADLAGSIASYKINKDMISKMKVNNYTPYQRYKLKTNYNINPQLDSTREQVNTMIDESKHNTASSRTDLARRQQYRNLGIRNTNELYGQKENIETQLINQDILNAQRTSQQNTQLVNDYLRRKTEMDNKVAELNAENAVSLAQNAAGVIGDYFDRRETRNREALDRAVIAASNPNAISYMDNELPKLARQFGYRPLSFNFGRFRKNK